MKIPLNKCFKYLVIIIVILMGILILTGWWASCHPAIESPELIG